MTRVPWFMIRKHLAAHWLRSGLTMAAMTVALFCFCTLISVVTSLNSTVSEAASNRVLVQSRVSLFVDMPLNYQSKIAGVDGVESVTKLQWFGGYYKERANLFPQFGIDEEVFFDQYREDIELIAGPGNTTGPAAREAVVAAMNADRRAAVIGQSLANEFGWKVGDTVPLLASIFQKADGGAWEFNIVGIYRALKPSMEERSMWFRFDYMEEGLKGSEMGDMLGVGCYAVNIIDGYLPEQVIRDIDKLFENGPQVTMTSTEAAFNASFVSMFGNVPLFVGSIGGAVLFAVFFSVLNTMLMAARQRTQESGIMKALGFRSSTLCFLMLGESLILSLGGGALGVGLAWMSAESMGPALERFISNYEVAHSTMYWGLALSLGIGVIAALGPSVLLSRLNTTQALRSEG